jgi:hypothetical protein
MGHYIETEVRENKVDWLLQQYPEMREITRGEVKFDKSGQSIFVCSADNGDSEAVGICCNRQELAFFSEKDDFRWKRWLVVPRALAIQLCPKVKGHLPGSKRKKRNVF